MRTSENRGRASTTSIRRRAELRSPASDLGLRSSLLSSIGMNANYATTVNIIDRVHDVESLTSSITGVRHVAVGSDYRRLKNGTASHSPTSRAIPSPPPTSSSASSSTSSAASPRAAVAAATASRYSVDASP